MSTLYNESILLTKYAPLLNHTVTAFMDKLNPHNRNGVLDADDLRQEVTIAFIGIIRTQGEEALGISGIHDQARRSDVFP